MMKNSMYELIVFENEPIKKLQTLFQRINFYRIPDNFTRNKIIAYKTASIEGIYFKIFNDEILDWINENKIEYKLKFEVIETYEFDIAKNCNLSIFLPDEETAFYFKLKFSY